jgi:hypothetical protein
MAFFSNTPRFTDMSNIVSVADVQDKITAFDVMYEASEARSSSRNCKDPNYAALWRKAVRSGAIHLVGTPMELDFFEKIQGAKTLKVDGTDVHVKTNGDVDLNIMAQADNQGNAPGGDATFVMHASLYSGNGKYSNVSQGGTVFIYEDEQWCKVHAVDRTVDGAHVVTLRPHSKDYTVRVRAGSKMLFSPVNLVDGVSCPNPASTWQSPGYIKVYRPFRVRKDYKFPIELERPYRDVLQFPIMWDENGKQIDSWEYKEKLEMRKELKWKKNIDFFIGQSIDNPALLAQWHNNKYAGFEGYVPTMRHGGGVIYDYDQPTGFDFDTDFNILMLRQDAFKGTTEFFLWAGFAFRLGMQRRMRDTIKNSSGSATFQAFERTGSFDAAAIKKMGVESYSYAGFTFHVKGLDALSDTRGIGNGMFPHIGMLMPANGIKDSNGNDVPPVEIFVPNGRSETGAYEEHFRDKRKIDGCEYLEGHAAESYSAAIHAPERHILLRAGAKC